MLTTCSLTTSGALSMASLLSRKIAVSRRIRLGEPRAADQESGRSAGLLAHCRQLRHTRAHRLDLDSSEVTRLGTPTQPTKNEAIVAVEVSGPTSGPAELAVASGRRPRGSASARTSCRLRTRLRKPLPPSERLRVRGTREGAPTHQGRRAQVTSSTGRRLRTSISTRDRGGSPDPPSRRGGREADATKDVRRS